jgi:hypothetical protein
VVVPTVRPLDDSAPVGFGPVSTHPLGSWPSRCRAVGCRLWRASTTIRRAADRVDVALGCAGSARSRCAIDVHGKPGLLVMDNGPEFTSRALDAWACQRGIALHWIDPGEPVQKVYVESINRRVPDECLTVHLFAGLEHACALIELWREDYNDVHPHSSDGDLPPNEFVRYCSGAFPRSAVNCGRVGCATTSRPESRSLREGRSPLRSGPCSRYGRTPG